MTKFRKPQIQIDPSEKFFLIFLSNGPGQLTEYLDVTSQVQDCRYVMYDFPKLLYLGHQYEAYKKRVGYLFFRDRWFKYRASKDRRLFFTFLGTELKLKQVSMKLASAYLEHTNQSLAVFLLHPNLEMRNIAEKIMSKNEKRSN